MNATTRTRWMLTLGLLCLASDLSAQDWTRFRGPNGSGISDATTVPQQWSADDYNWVVDLPGRGHSSPVGWQQQVFVTASDATTEQQTLICLDRDTGRILWQKSEPFQPYRKHKNNSFASGTPCVDRHGVYTIWHGRDRSPLIAYDFDGNERWRFDLGPYTHGQGGATSPIVSDDVLFVAHDQKPPSFLYAIDVNTGRPIWKQARAGRRACYSTPCLRQTSDGRQQVIFTHCFEGITGHDPETGRQLWLADVFGRTSQRALGSPVLAEDLVIATSGAVGGDRQLVAVRPPMVRFDDSSKTNSAASKPAAGSVNLSDNQAKTDSATKTSDPPLASEVFRTVRQTPHVPTPIVVKDRLFIVSDQGIASCLNAASGDTIWKQRIGGNYFGSPICVNGVIYCIDVDGRVLVFAAADTFKKLGQVELGEASKSTPAVSTGRLYLRTESKLFSVGG